MSRPGKWPKGQGKNPATVKPVNGFNPSIVNRQKNDPNEILSHLNGVQGMVAGVGYLGIEVLSNGPAFRRNLFSSTYDLSRTRKNLLARINVGMSRQSQPTVRCFETGYGRRTFMAGAAIDHESV